MHCFKSGLALLSAFILCSGLSACGGGGGSSDDSGMTIEGTLTEAGGANHSAAVNLKHSDGERIGGVTVCALGGCSVTDDQGQFGFEAGAGFTGGDVLFTLNGHGIATTSIVEIPAGAQEVIIDFQHVEGGAIHADHVTVDGETSHHEDDAHE